MKKQIKVLSLALGLMLSVVAQPQKAEALTSGFDSINFDPAISSRQDYFGVYSSHTNPKGSWHLGLTLDYARNPLEFGAPVGTRTGALKTDELVANFHFAYSPLDWLTVGMNLPVVGYMDTLPLLTTGPAATFDVADTTTQLGDIRFELKFRVRNNEDRLIGVALVPFFTLPTGPSNLFAGNEHVTGGLKAVLDFNISERVKLALNVGALIRDDVTVLNAEVEHQLLVGLGLSIKIIEKLHLLLEVDYQPVLNAIGDFSGNDEVLNPLELRAGVRIPLTERWQIKAAGRIGATVGIGTPDYGAILGVSYTWTPEPCNCNPIVEERGDIVISQRIHFEFDRAVIKDDSYHILNDVAALIKGNAGRVSRVSVEGHTDSIGSDSYNQALSEARANAVRDYLINQGGVSASKLEAVGYGEGAPIDDNNTAAGRANNRRTEFKVYGK